MMNTPVACLWKDPSHEALESQLLYGEKVQVESEQGEWLYVKALEQQKCFPDGSWGPYPGWIERKFLSVASNTPNLMVTSNEAEFSLGTRLEGTEEKEDHWVIKLLNGKKGTIKKDHVFKTSPDVRQSIIDIGRKMLGFPYLWGGRSSFNPTWGTTSVDCSGFVNLLYRIHGIEVPRDAHDQFLKATPCKTPALGDLIFTASADKPNRITHVMIYSGHDNLLEATSASGSVREVPAPVRFNRPISEVISGKIYNNYVVHFGTV